jgi:hypothetical protein
MIDEQPESAEAPEAASAPAPESAEVAPVKVGDQDMVPVAALTGERRRITEKYERELEPLRAAASRVQQLEQEVAQLRTPKRVEPDIPDVSDDEAERYARHYELYNTQGLDLTRAKRIIKDNRDEIRRVAKDAVAEAVGPVRAGTLNQVKREQFIRAATATDAGGSPLLDQAGQQELAAAFSLMPPDLFAENPEGVADVVLERVLGARLRQRKPGPLPPSREPGFSEAPGGYRGAGYTISNLEKKVAASAGVSAKDWESRAKGYQPGIPNTLE